MLATWPPSALVHDRQLINESPQMLLRLYQTKPTIEKKDAFSAIYNCYAPPIWRYIYKNISESESDAKDIFCQVWLVALENLDEFEWQTESRSNDPLRAWLFECARRRIQEYHRKKKLDVSIEENIETKLMSFLEPDAKSAHDQQVYRILQTLKDDHRTILTLRYYNHMSFGEIGRVVGKSENAVRKQHHDIINRLRKSFGGGS